MTTLDHFPGETQGHATLLLGPDLTSRYLPPKVRVRYQAGKSLGSISPLVLLERASWGETTSHLSEETRPCSQVCPHWSCFRQARQLSALLPACPSVGESATHQSFVSARAGARQPAWTQSGVDGQGHTQLTPGPAHGARNTFLNHMDGKGLTHLPHQVSINLQERFWKREAMSAQSGGTENP